MCCRRVVFYMLVEDILCKLAALNHLRVARLGRADLRLAAGPARVARNSKSGRPAHQFFGLARPAAAQEQKSAQAGLARYGPARAENFAFPDGQKIHGWAEMGQAVPPVGGRVAQIRPGPIFVPGPGRAENSMGRAGPPNRDFRATLRWLRAASLHKMSSTNREKTTRLHNTSLT